METRLIDSFTDESFREGFMLYFGELAITVRDWDGLFKEMDTDGRGNLAYLGMDGSKTVGFIQFCPMDCEGWFMKKTLGFIREFWIAPEYRGQGCGSELLGLAEEYFKQKRITAVALTTDTAPSFYIKHGYRHDPGFAAKNGDPVYIKHLY